MSYALETCEGETSLQPGRDMHGAVAGRKGLTRVPLLVLVLVLVLAAGRDTSGATTRPTPAKTGAFGKGHLRVVVPEFVELWL